MLDLRGDITRLKIVWFFLQCQFWFPVWVTFLTRDRGLSLGDVVAADVAYSATVIALEVPLGMFADFFGHKRTVILGAIVAAATQLAIPTIDGPGMLVAVWFIWAVSSTLLSGSDTAYRYEVIAAEGQRPRMVQLFGHFAAIRSISILGTHAAASFTYALDPGLPFRLNAVAAVVALVVLTTMSNPEETERVVPSAHRLLRQTRDAFRLDVSARWLAIALAVSFAYFWTVTLIFQPLMLSSGLPETGLGVTHAVVGGVGALGALCSSRVQRWIGVRGAIVGGLALQASGALLAASSHVVPTIGGLALQSFSLLAVDPILRVALNHRVASSMRASVFSVVSLATTALMLVSRPVVGLVAAERSAAFAFGVWAALGLLLCVAAATTVPQIALDDEKTTT